MTIIQLVLRLEALQKRIEEINDDIDTLVSDTRLLQFKLVGPTEYTKEEYKDDDKTRI